MEDWLEVAEMEDWLEVAEMKDWLEVAEMEDCGLKWWRERWRRITNRLVVSRCAVGVMKLLS